MSSIIIEEQVGEALRAARADRGMSQSQLAARSGIASSEISRYETGRRAITVHELVLLARSLETTVARLLEGVR